MSYEPAYAAARFQTRLKLRTDARPDPQSVASQGIARRPSPRPAALSVDPAGELVVKPKVETQPTTW